jgi:hypothetical protein
VVVLLTWSVDEDCGLVEDTSEEVSEDAESIVVTAIVVVFNPNFVVVVVVVVVAVVVLVPSVTSLVVVVVVVAGSRLQVVFEWTQPMVCVDGCYQQQQKQTLSCRTTPVVDSDKRVILRKR